jgi:hypothetical protein
MPPAQARQKVHSNEQMTAPESLLEDRDCSIRNWDEASTFFSPHSRGGCCHSGGRILRGQGKCLINGDVFGLRQAIKAKKKGRERGPFQ